MSDFPAPEGADAIVREHREIHVLLSELDAAAGLPRTLELLLELRALLETHFRHEEAGGLREVVLETAPRLLGRADALLQEHRDFLADVSGLVDDCRSILEGPVRELRETVRAVSDRLGVHDTAENELLSEAVLDDIGTGD